MTFTIKSIKKLANANTPVTHIPEGQSRSHSGIKVLNRLPTNMPDIDYDVSSPMELKETLIEEWGDNVVVPISNWNTLQLRSLIKDISKFYDIPFAESNLVTSKMLFEATPIAKKAHGIKAGVYTPTFEEVMEYSDTLRNFLKKYPDCFWKGYLPKAIDVWGQL